MISKPLPLRSRLSYGAATLGTGSFLVVPQLFLLFFMTDHLGIAAAWASVTLLIPKLWEFLTDPYIGLRSDQTRSRWGQRHPYMLCGAALLSLGIALVFNVPLLESAHERWLYVTGMFILATTGYGLFIVPYTALLGEIAQDPDERTRLVALRMGFLGLSLLIAAVGWPELLKSLGSTREAYGFVGVCVGALCLAAMLVTVMGTLRVPRHSRPGTTAPLTEQLRIVLGERAFVLLAVTYGLQVLAQSINSTMLAYVGKYLSPLGADFLPLYFGTVTISSIVAMSIWPGVARRVSAPTAYLWGSVLGLAGYWVSAWSVSGPTALLLAGAALGGIGFAAGQVFGFSLLPEIVDSYRQRTGHHRDGAFTGVWVGWEKMALAIGATLAGLVLGWCGFEASTGQDVKQPALALQAMAWLFGVVPGGLLLVSILTLRSLAHEKKRVA